MPTLREIYDSMAAPPAEEVYDTMEGSDPGGSWWREPVGALETGLAIGTGSALEIPAGLWGLVKGVTAHAEGEDVATAAAEGQQSVMDYSYTPRTAQGQRNLNVIGRVMEPVVEAIGQPAEHIYEWTESPEAATGTQTLVEGALALTPPGRLMRGTQAARRAAALKEGRQAASRAGIDLNAPAIVQREQAQKQLLRELDEHTEIPKGAGEVDLLDNLREAYDMERDLVNQAYEEARSPKYRATIPVVFAAGHLPSLMRHALDGQHQFWKNSARVRGVFKYIDTNLGELLKKEGHDATVAFSKLEDVRKYISTELAEAKSGSRKSRTDVSKLAILKKVYDNFTDEMLEKELFSGSKEAITVIKNARDRHRQFAAKFRDPKVIRKLLDEGITPEQARNYIVGGSKIVGQAGAGTAIRHLKAIFGDDSPQIDAIRKEQIFNLAEPILEGPPTVKGAKQFLANVRRMRLNNSSLYKELFTQDASAIADLERVLQAVPDAANYSLRGFGLSVDRAVSVWLAGHGIARAGLRVAAIATGFNLLRGVARGTLEAGRARQALANMTGYDPYTPLNQGIVSGALYQQLEDQAEQASGALTPQLRDYVKWGAAAPDTTYDDASGADPYQRGTYP